MNDFSQSVIIPRDDFIELQQAAWNQPTPTTGERVATTLQTTAVMAVMTAAIGGATWAASTAVDWLETRRLLRARALRDIENDNLD